MMTIRLISDKEVSEVDTTDIPSNSLVNVSTLVLDNSIDVVKRSAVTNSRRDLDIVANTSSNMAAPTL